MMYYTHIVFGLLIALLTSDILDIQNKLLFISIIIVFSIFPDIDNTKSKIGKKNRIISRIINFIFGHRGFFHSIYIPLILFFVFYNLNNELGIAILVGYLSHLFMDALTRNGIRPFYPLVNIKINGFFKTNSLLEKIFFLAVILLDMYILLSYI